MGKHIRFKEIQRDLYLRSLSFKNQKRKQQVKGNVALIGQYPELISFFYCAFIIFFSRFLNQKENVMIKKTTCKYILFFLSSKVSKTNNLFFFYLCFPSFSLSSLYSIMTYSGNKSWGCSFGGCHLAHNLLNKVA